MPTVYLFLFHFTSISKGVNMTSDQNSSTHIPINITNFNVNGLGLYIQRQSIFNKLKSDNGVTILQETHSSSTNEKNGQTNVEDKLYFLMVYQTVEE